MKVPLRWLSDYIDLPTQDPHELRDALASLGHKVEDLEIREPEWSGVVVARVDEIRPHPNADKIRLCTVSMGREPIEVVCGAWNFDTGARVAFAGPGAVLPGGFEIGRRQIRGVESVGMICSERELGLGDDGAGILVLDHDAPIGVDLTEIVALPEVIFDLEITPNRPDAMSMVGIARELAAYFQVPYALPPTEPHTVPGDSAVTVVIEDPSGCYRFVARELRGARVGASPFWMRQRLQRAGIRPISNIVDVTNYVMVELGQPLHAFDLDRVAGSRIVVRRARAGERLTTLDGVDRALLPSDLVVADAERASGLAGTMGGQNSEVNAATTSVLIEAAAWDPPTIMNMSRRLGLRSEASSRFERGVDPNLPPLAAARANRLMLEVAGGESPAGGVDQVAVAFDPITIDLSSHEVFRVLGSVIPTDAIGPLLTRFGFGVEGTDPIAVTVPTYRRDIERPVDLIEELARLHGLEKFPETLPTGPAGGWSTEQRRHRQLRRLMTGAGVSQAVNLSFAGIDDLNSFAYPAEHEGRLTIAVKNPLNDELAVLRTSLLPGLLRTLRYNISRGANDVALFETGRVFMARPWEEDRRVPAQPERLGFAIRGRFGPGGIGAEPRPADLYTATALWRLLASGLDLDAVELRQAVAPGFHPGRTSEVMMRGQSIGFIGELHPTTAAAYEIDGRVAVGELEMNALIGAVGRWQLAQPSVYPAVDFDLAFEVPAEIAAADLVSATAGTQTEMLESVEVFDQYQGRGVGEGRKSLALRFVFRAPNHTLTTDEIAALRQTLIAAAARVGAILRGGP